MEASRLAARFPNNAELQYRMGTVLQSCEAYADAVVLFRRALASAPERREWNAELTGALITLRRYEEARIALDSGLESHPNHPGLLMAGSLLAQAVGGIDEALKFAEKVLRQNRIMSFMQPIYCRFSFWWIRGGLGSFILSTFSDIQTRSDFDASLPLSNFTGRM